MEKNDTEHVPEKHLSHQRILILLLVALFSGIVFGLIGYFIGKGSTSYEQRQNTILQSVPSTELSKATLKQPSNPYAGWKQYCSKLEKSCIKYPPNWSIKSQEYVNADTAVLTNPLGDQITLNTPSNGADDKLCSKTQQVYIHKVIPNPHVANLYVVETSIGAQSSIQQIALVNTTDKAVVYGNGNLSKGPKPVVGYTGDCVLQGLFQDKNLEPNIDKSSFSSFPIKPSDLPTAELILESYTY